jgi:hypothetical protein
VHRDDFRDDLPPSRGQWQTIARDALDLLGLDHPTSRADATETLVRLKRTRDQPDTPRPTPVPDPAEF